MNARGYCIRLLGRPICTFRIPYRHSGSLAATTTVYSKNFGTYHPCKCMPNVDPRGQQYRRGHPIQHQVSPKLYQIKDGISLREKKRQPLERISMRRMKPTTSRNTAKHADTSEETKKAPTTRKKTNNSRSSPPKTPSKQPNENVNKGSFSLTMPSENACFPSGKINRPPS